MAEKSIFQLAQEAQQAELINRLQAAQAELDRTNHDESFKEINKTDEQTKLDPKSAELDQKSAELSMIKAIEAKQQFAMKQAALAQVHKAAGNIAKATKQEVSVTQELSPSGNHRLIIEYGGKAYISDWVPGMYIAKVEVDGDIYCGVSDRDDLPRVFTVTPVKHATRKV